MLQLTWLADNDEVWLAAENASTFGTKCVAMERILKRADVRVLAALLQVSCDDECFNANKDINETRKC